MSPLTIDRIKRANGNVRITEAAGAYSVQVLEGGAWVTVLTNGSREICEQTVRSAAGKLILG